MVPTFKGNNGCLNFKYNLIIFILSILPTTQQSWSNFLLAMYNVYCIWSNTSSVNIVTIHFKTLTRMTGKWQLVWRTPDGGNFPLPNISHWPYKCRSVHITVQGALDINSWPHVRVLFTDVCAQSSLNARLSWSPDLICTDVCARLDRPMCTVQSAKCKCAR